MKKYQYIVAAACVLAGAAGFAGMYAMEQAERQQQELVQKELVQKEEESESDLLQEQQIAYQSSETEAEGEADAKQQENGEEQQLAMETKKQEVPQQKVEQKQLENTVVQKQEAEAGTIQDETLHFRPEDGIMWPVEGKVILDYSMDSTIFFPTLQQYKYHPAMVFSANVNDKVYFIAKGKIIDISTNEETGCTVKQDIGDGYTAVYGQLKELNFKVGDMVESGQVAGYVSEPTKYYAVEGNNVYFQLLKDGEAIDPETVMPQKE